VIGFWLLGLSIPFTFLSNLTGEKAALIAGGKGFPTKTLELLRLHESFADVLHGEVQSFSFFGFISFLEIWKTNGLIILRLPSWVYFLL
jgi:hypothetical protein